MLAVVLPLCNHNYVSLVAMIAVKFQFSWFRWLYGSQTLNGEDAPALPQGVQKCS